MYLANEIILTYKKGGCYEKDFYSISNANISNAFNAIGKR